MKFNDLVIIMDKAFNCTDNIKDTLLMLKNSTDNINYYNIIGMNESTFCILHTFVFENNTTTIIMELKDGSQSKLYGCFNFSNLTKIEVQENVPFNLLHNIFETSKNIITIKKRFIDKIDTLLRDITKII